MFPVICDLNKEIVLYVLKYAIKIIRILMLILTQLFVQYIYLPSVARAFLVGQIRCDIPANTECTIRTLN